MDIGSYADWFSGSMSALAVVTALAGYWLAGKQRDRDHKEASKRAGRTVGIKLLKILNGTHDIHRHLWAPYVGPPLGGEGANEIWRTIHPLIGLQEDPALALDGAETNLLVEMEETDFLMNLNLANARYQSIVSSMKDYAIRYEAIYRMSPAPTSIDGIVGQHILTRQQYLRIKPYSIALENLIQGLRAMTAENVDLCEDLAEKYAPIMKRHFRTTKFLSFHKPDAAPV